MTGALSFRSIERKYVSVGVHIQLEWYLVLNDRHIVGDRLTDLIGELTGLAISDPMRKRLKEVAAMLCV